MYDLLLGGLLSATLVPLFSTFVETDDDESTNVVLTVSVVLMAALTVVAVVAAPLIFGLYSVNVADGVDADLYRSVGTTLARIFLIQILFYGLVGLANAFLNSRRRFFAAAWSADPAERHHHRLPAVAAEPRVGRLAARGRALRRPPPLDARARRHRRHRHDGRRARAGDVRAPASDSARSSTSDTLRCASCCRCRSGRSGSSWPTRSRSLVVRNLAEPGSSDASAYINAFTFFVLPHGLLAVSIATTFQPEMSRSVARRDRAGFVDQASLGLRMTALFTIPAGVGIFVLRQPIIGALLQRGEFSADDADAAQRALGGSRARARRVLDLHVRAARLLRPQGHQDAVQDQRGGEPHQHRARRSSSSIVTACSDSGSRSRSRT